MFRFPNPQKVFDIAGVKVGGQPGELPTVMIGSVFYRGHRVVKDERTGKFDREEAEKLLKLEEEMSDMTGNPRIVDICISWPEAAEKFIDFVAGVVDCPLSIDGTTAEVRIAAASYVGEVGLSRRVVFNSITPHTGEEELRAVRNAGIRSAILMTLNTRDLTTKGRLETLKSLLKLSREAGIENTLIDATVIDIPDPGLVGKAVYMVKERYGLPAGAGAHNAIAGWKRRVRRPDRDKLIVMESVANAVLVAMGADFVIYGPITGFKTAYLSCALADAYVAYSAMQEYRTRPLTEGHPIYRVFKG